MKKFFTAVILAVFILSAQIAFAADVDWNSAPRINSKAQLANYIENGRRKGQTEFNFVITYVKLNNEDEFNNWHFNYNLVSFGTGRFTFNITNEYPGTRVANAYLSREPHMARMNLTAEEQKLYNIAVGIVGEANKRN